MYNVYYNIWGEITQSFKIFQELFMCKTSVISSSKRLKQEKIARKVLWQSFYCAFVIPKTELIVALVCV